ncbi:NAD(P)H dehydrogenase (quinone), partial [Phenoliferia sp. Uapishka_3]
MVATTSQSAPLFVVVGATGSQGGSVITHLIASDKQYRIRGITRDPTKPSSAALASRGVEVVKGDLGSPDEIKAAFKGADYVYGVTNFWETMNAEKEINDGKLLVDSAKEAGVKLFVWSGLEPVSKISKGKFTKVKHFDTKAEISEYAKTSGVPVAVVQPGFYLSNFTSKMIPRKQEDGTYVLALPIASSAKIPMLDTDADYGAYVVEAVESPSFGAGSEVLAASEYISLAEVTKIWSEVSGKTIIHREVPDATFEKMVPRGGDELAEMLRFFQEFGFFGGKDIAPSQRGLKAPMHTFETFARKTDWGKIFA